MNTKTTSDLLQAESGTPILELSGVTYRQTPLSAALMMNLDLVVVASDLVLVNLPRATSVRGPVSMMQGLVDPSSGRVHFCGSSWTKGTHEEHFRMRSRIGRVFESHAWIENLNVIENVTLAAQHHGIAIHEVTDRLRRLADRFGVRRLAEERPAYVDVGVLQVYQWIRALICRPRLLLLERPLRSLPVDLTSVCRELIHEVRQAGTAVIWFTSNEPDWIGDEPTNQLRRFHLAGGNLNDLSIGVSV